MTVSAVRRETTLDSPSGRSVPATTSEESVEGGAPGREELLLETPATLLPPASWRRRRRRRPCPPKDGGKPPPPPPRRLALRGPRGGAVRGRLAAAITEAAGCCLGGTPPPPPPPTAAVAGLGARVGAVDGLPTARACRSRRPPSTVRHQPTSHGWPWMDALDTCREAPGDVAAGRGRAAAAAAASCDLPAGCAASCVAWTQSRGRWSVMRGRGRRPARAGSPAIHARRCRRIRIAW
jgi:hypothetical protein